MFDDLADSTLKIKQEISKRFGVPPEKLSFIVSGVELYREYNTLREFWTDIVQEDINKKLAETHDQEMDKKVKIEVVHSEFSKEV